MKTITFSWPEGKEGACTTSWDDGTVHDRKLVDILNRSGLKGTFNLNSGKLGMNAAQSGWKPYIEAAEIPELFKGHEVAVHTVNHPYLWRCPDDVIRNEVREDRKNLESIVKYPVTGMAFPYGGPNDLRVRKILQDEGIAYSRSIDCNDKFELPLDFLFWTPTCHCSHDLFMLWDKFIGNRMPDKLFYLWGHSFEFEERKDWNKIEKFSGYAGNKENIWHATNMEVYDYVNAWRSLICAAGMSSIRNISGVTLSLRQQDKLLKIKPGEILVL